MTYEERKKSVCETCPSHDDDYCGWVKRNLQGKCLNLNEVMRGWELGKQDAIEAIEGACMNGVTAEQKYKNVLDRINELRKL